jgi:hypothetical protein
VVEGGYNHWLAEFPLDACLAKPYPKPAGGFRSEQFQYFFSQAVGETVFSAHPECPGCRDPEHGCESKRLVPHSVPALPTGFERKVKIRTQAKQKGGCG